MLVFEERKKHYCTRLYSTSGNTFGASKKADSKLKPHMAGITSRIHANLGRIRGRRGYALTTTSIGTDELLFKQYLYWINLGFWETAHLPNP